MTLQEALTIRNNPTFEDVYNDELAKCIDEALERQIPMKPDTETINRGIGISGEYDIDSNYICPNCKNVVGDYENEDHYYDFCPDCGQALDWEQSNDTET